MIFCLSTVVLKTCLPWNLEWWLFACPALNDELLSCNRNLSCLIIWENCSGISIILCLCLDCRLESLGAGYDLISLYLSRIFLYITTISFLYSVEIYGFSWHIWHIYTLAWLQLENFVCYVNYSLNWQHQLCKTPRSNPDIKTLFFDHSCGQPNGARAPSPANNPLLGSLPKAGGFPPLGAHGVGH